MSYLSLPAFFGYSSLCQFPMYAKRTKDRVPFRKIAFYIIGTIAQIFDEFTMFIDEIRIKVLEFFWPFIIRVSLAISDVFDIEFWQAYIISPDMYLI